MKHPSAERGFFREVQQYTSIQIAEFKIFDFAVLKSVRHIEITQ
jgi:hypothetical protein